MNNQNLAFLGAEGIDLDTDYAMDIGEGTLGFRFIGTYRLGQDNQALPGDPIYDCSGYYGGRFGQCGEPQPEWKHTMFVNYGLGALNTTLRWRYIGESEADDALSLTDDIPGNDQSNIGEFIGSSIDGVSYFDLSANYAVSDSLTLRGGITNLLDEEPPVLSDVFAEQANTYPATYGALGRRFFVGVTAGF